MDHRRTLPIASGLALALVLAPLLVIPSARAFASTAGGAEEKGPAEEKVVPEGKDAVPKGVRVISERNAGSDATPAFAFRKVPPPSARDAATNARFSLVLGEPDPNGADVDALNDGKLPRHDDQPDACFFFAAGTPGGRLLVDLGEAVEIRRVGTYSWHRSTRGPQVYRLWASDGAAEGIRPRPGKGIDPEESGWKPIASVDTRPEEGSPGGQYGVSIAREDGSPLGTYRYLLLDVARTEDGDPFGNTFFGEIDVDDGKEHAPAAAADSGGPPRYEILIDFSEMPELEGWVEKKLRPTLEKWYPIIVEALPSDGFVAPRRLTVTFRKDMRGVAATSGRRISCAGEWFRRNLDGEAVGAVVHELVHVAQQYRGRGNPGWLVEGVADWIRWFQYEPESLRPRPDPARARYTDSYRTTAAFLHYLTEKHDKDLVKRLNAAMREGRYSADLWKEHLGKTVDDLWAEYAETLKGDRGPSGSAGRRGAEGGAGRRGSRAAEGDAGDPEGAAEGG